MTRTHAGRSRSVIDIMEEAAHLLKGDGLRLVPYYIGSLPFVLAFVYFWTDMSTGAGAWRRVPQSAWLLSLLFVWMKTWQSVYARCLLSSIRGSYPAKWKGKRIFRTLLIQTAIQPWAIVALPIALLVLLPFPQVFAFFQNAALFGSGDDDDLGKVLRKSWHQAGLWPTQNTLLIWLGSPFLVVLAALLLFAVVPAVVAFLPDASRLAMLLPAAFVLVALSPLAMVVALNLGLAMFLAPQLFHILFGVETALSRSNGWVLSDTFFVVLCSLVYLCLDPLLKACYCLRCFYGASVQTGEDLKVELRALKRPTGAALIILFLALAVSGHASAHAVLAATTATVSASDLNAAIERTIHLPRYEWRMPREKPPAPAHRQSALAAFFAPVARALRAAFSFLGRLASKAMAFIVDFLTRIMPTPAGEEQNGGKWTSLSKALIIVPLSCLVVLFAFFGFRIWRRRSRTKVQEAMEATPVVDIAREDIDARALPEDGWMEMVRTLIEKGEPRYALRAFFLATLALLADLRLVSLEPHKSDREYERELRTRFQADAKVPLLFAENRVLFERTWYGLYEVTPDMIERFRQNHERIREHGQP